MIVDTTVMEKAIAYPTDSRLLERCREHRVKAAARHGLKLRQNYNREAPRLDQLVSFERREHLVKNRPMHSKRVGMYVNTRRMQYQACVKVFSETH